MTVKTPGDECLRKTCRKTGILLVLAVLGALFLSAPADAYHTGTSVVVFTDKRVYNPFAIDMQKTGGTPAYDKDLAADFSIYVYAIVLDEKGLIMKGREGQLTGTLVDSKEYKHTDLNNHIGATVNNPGIVGTKTLTFKDDGTVNGDVSGDGIYVAVVDMPENIGTKLAAPTDELLINITVTDPQAGSAYAEVLIAGFNCMSSPEFSSSYPAHTSSTAAKSDNCVVCHRAYEHFFENISGAIQYQNLDAHFKNATTRSRVQNPLHSTNQQKADFSLKFRWNLSDYNGAYGSSRTLEAMAPGSSFCFFCHTYNFTVAPLKYGDKRSDLTSIPTCNSSNCHTTTKIAGNAAPSWSPAAAAPASELTSVSVSSPNYNASRAEKHAHDSTGKDTVPCASCHGTVHSVQIPNSTSNDYQDLALRCLSCHQLFNKHNSSVSCVNCHTNDTHNIRFLQEDLSYNWTTTAIVACDNCHTNSSFGPALGLNPPQVPYTNHSGDSDAGQKWGDYWTSKSQQAAAGGSELIQSSTVVVSTESAQYGTTVNFGNAQSADGSYETLTEGLRSVPPRDDYTYVDGNTTSLGSITNWNNIKNATDGNATANFTEAIPASRDPAIINGNFTLDNNSWDKTLVLTAGDNVPFDILNFNTGTPQFNASRAYLQGRNDIGEGNITQTFDISDTDLRRKVNLTFKFRKFASVAATTAHTLNVKLVRPNGTAAYTFSDTNTQSPGTSAWSTQNINVTPYIDQTGTWTLEVYNRINTANNANAEGATDVDDVNITFPAPYSYGLVVENSFSGVPQADYYYLEMNYKTQGDTYDLYLYNGSAWNARAVLNSAGFTTLNYTMQADEYSSGSPVVKILDRTSSAATQGNISIDYMRIHGWTADTSHQEINLNHNFTGVPKYAAQETAEYTALIRGYVNAGENLDIYAYDYSTSSYLLIKDNAFPTSNGWVNYSLPYTAISDGGNANIQFRDKNKTRYDSVQDSFYLDYVAIKADNYKYLPCYYCHALLANHKKRALGNIEWVQTGDTDKNLMNSTNLSGYWCANCHYNGSTPSGKYKYNGSAWNPVPPLININNLDPGNPNYGSWYQHDVASNFTDAKCKECHGTAAVETTKDFPHSVEVGSSGGANCTNCHNIGGSAGTGRLVNLTAMNDTNAIHRNLNRDASTSLPAENRRCWACHGNGSEPGSGHPSNYKTPYKCVDCHIAATGQNLNFTPDTILNVTQHYWNGTNITTANATSCYSCHNRSEMMLGSYDPDGAGTGVYSGANGGNNSTSHYGRKRTDMAGMANLTYCYYCHNNASSVFPFINSSNRTIANHSANYPSTNPECKECHSYGRIHNSTLYKPAFVLPNSSYCLNCHGSGGSATIKNLERHNGSSGLNCTQCHLNATNSIHPVRYLQQDSTWDTSKANAVNCTTCHQLGLSGFTSAPKVPTPMNHSINSYSGALWNGTQSAYWDNTSQQSTCDYCHGKISLHNSSGLGNITRINGTNSVKQSLSGGYWCANCHYNGSAPSGKYNYKGNLFNPVPPEILNLTGLVPAVSRSGVNFENHSGYVGSGYDDSACKTCHDNNLDAGATSLNFSHNVGIGVAGGSNCTNCHDVSGTLTGGKKVNFTAMNDSLAIHKNLNRDASTSLPAENKRCWACHGNGSEPSGGHPANYKTPYKCADCHVVDAGQNLNFTPNTILNVTQHYWNGTSIDTSAATSCYDCHNRSEMMLGSYDPDGAAGVYSGANGGNNSTSHYGRKRTDMAGMANLTYCNYCHNNASSVFPFINSSNKTIANHSLNYASTNPECKECHSSGRIHNSTLYKPAFALPNSSYCLTCHGSGGSATIRNLERHNGTSGLNCTQCHLNATKSIHPVRYLQQDGSAWDTSKTNAVNCTLCHQLGLSGFGTAPITPKPMNHSTNSYAGALWNNTQPAYWTNTSQLSSCEYCHGKIAYHNNSGLGNITKVQGTNNTVRQNLDYSRWCASCHYAGAAGYAGTSFYPEPPEITNASGKVPAKARDNTNFYNHTQDMATGYNDSKCKSCHDNALDAGATSLNFSHNLAAGGGGANCTSCHYIGAGVQNINITAMTSADFIHKDLNNDASASDNGLNGSKKCWACHGDGEEPSGHPTRYKTPYNCTDCHVVAAGQNFNYTPNAILNVTQHYWNGTSIKTPAANSCYACHNTTGMITAAYDPDGSSSNVYGGANGGNASVSHYGKKRSDMAAQQNTTPYCDNCHSSASSFPFSDDANRTISNHSLSYASTNPVCRDCHEGGRIHNSTLYKVTLTLPNASYCLSCHDSGGSASIKNLERHNDTGTSCTQCHLNSSNSIHPVRYLQQDDTWSTAKTNAVNCTTCHQGSGLSGFATAPKVPLLNHSTNPYSGALWNGTQSGFWDNTTQQSSCDYCHGKAALHNLSGLGNITRVKGDNMVKQSFAGGYWCANCHYSGAGNYSGTQFSPQPPEVQNASGLVPSNARDGTQFYNHSADLSSGYDDAKCKTCHNNNLDAGATSLNFTHSLGSGGGGPNCTSCHGLGGTLTDGKRINQTAMNNSLALHKNLNKDASASDANYSENKKCWACHGDGTEPSGHPTRYKTPYNCVDCHVPGAGQNFDYNPNAILNVSQHYWNGTSINTSNATSCYACHNKTEMMAGATLDPDGASGVYSGANGGNASVSHYGKKRSDMAAFDNTSYCNYCHSNASSVFPFINSSNKTIANHSANYPSTNPACSECHASGRIHNDTLYKPSFVLPNSTYCLSCHGSGGSAGIKNLERHNGTTGLNCTQCHVNSTNSIHPVRYLQQNSTWSTSNASAVNCTTCHQGTGMSGFGTAPLVQTPIWHSNNSYSGALWNGSQQRFWDNTSQQSSCDYCHGEEALHNISGLGKSALVQGTNSKNQSLSGGYWCANCHYNGSSPSGNYAYKGNLFSPVPPEVFNLTGLVPANSSTDMPFQNHSTNIAGDWSDNRCKSCHGKDLPSDTTSATFLHKLNQSQPEAGGPDCLKCHSDTANEPNGPPWDRRINKTVFTNLSVHRNLNSNATNTTELTDNRSKACWACHSDGTQPIKHPVNYLNPKPCVNCHVNETTLPNPTGAFNAPVVGKHYPGKEFMGQKKHSSNFTEGSCQVCHNNSVGYRNATDNLNTTISHYATLGNLAQTDISNSCADCHAGATTYGVPKQLVDQAKHSMNGACQATCHNPYYYNATTVNPINLHNASLGIYYNCYAGGCHVQPTRSGRGGNR